MTVRTKTLALRQAQGPASDTESLSKPFDIFRFKNYSYMKSKSSKVALIFFMVGIFFCSSTSKYSKKHFKGVGKIDTNLFKESFEIYSGGALANSSYSYYLTDSATFRKYIGTVYFDDELLHCKKLNSNEVLVYKISRTKEGDTLERKIYIISDLQKEGLKE